MLVFVCASVAFAQESTPEPLPLVQTQGYIQINNGNPITTNPGQRPQIVVQFGNRGNPTLLDVEVDCGVKNDLGSLGAAYGNAFRVIGKYDEYVVPGFGPVGYDLITFGFNYDNANNDNVNLPPGQNYNVAFEVNVSAPRGFVGWVQCALYSPTDPDFMVAQTAQIPIRVR